MSLLHHVSEWLEATALSRAIQDVSWLVPAVQTVHILAIALLIGAALALTLHVLGASARTESELSVSSRYLPLIWWALPVLLLSGAVLIVAEPARSLANPVFALKMFMLLVASGVTLAYQLPLERDENYWRISPVHRLASRALGFVALGLWVGVILAGRWIAYVDAL